MLFRRLEVIFYVIMVLLVGFAIQGCYEYVQPAVIAVDRHGNPPGMEMAIDEDWCGGVSARLIWKFHKGAPCPYDQAAIMDSINTDWDDFVDYVEYALFMNHHGFDIHLRAEATMSGHMTVFRNNILNGIPGVLNFWNQHMLVGLAFTYDTLVSNMKGAVFSDPAGNTSGWGDGYEIPAIYWHIDEGRFDDYMYRSNGYYRAAYNATSRLSGPQPSIADKKDIPIIGGVDVGAGRFKDLYRVFHLGRENPVGEDLPYGDGDLGGCDGECPPPDTMEQHRQNKAWYYLMTRTDTLLLSCIRPYIGGGGISFLPSRTTKAQPSGAAKMNALGEAQAPINMIVVPFAGKHGDEIGAVVFTGDISERYVETAFYPPNDDGRGKLAPRDSTLDLTTWAMNFTRALQEDPGSVTRCATAQNIISAEAYYERGLLPEGWSAENVYDPNPELQMRPFWHAVEIRDENGEVVDIHSVLGTDLKYWRDADGDLHKVIDEAEDDSERASDEDVRELATSKQTLLQNYPNPFNAGTTIGFELREAKHVKLEIYDILGRRVETLVDRLMVSGRYSVTFNSDKQPSGIYFYRLTAGELTETRKMVLMK